MANESPTEICIVSVSYGYVLAWQKTGNPSQTVVQVNDGPSNKAQRWIVEPGDEPNVIALKNVANGEYLNCKEQNNWGKVNQGEKQFWRLDHSDVNPPGAVRMQPAEFSTHWLNHHGPSRVNKGQGGERAHMWNWYQDFNTTWFLMPGDDFDALALATGGGASKTNEEAAAKLKDVESREAAVGKAEQNLANKQKTLQEKEAELAKRDTQLQDEIRAKQKDLQDKEASLATSTQEQKSQQAAELQKLQDREASLAQREKDLAQGSKDAADFQQKLKDLQDREQALASKEEDDATSSKQHLDDLHSREKALADKEKAQAKDTMKKLDGLQQRERELDERERLAKPRGEAAAGNGATKANQSKPRGGQKEATSNGTKEAPEDPMIRALIERLAKVEDELAASRKKPNSGGDDKPAKATAPSNKPSASPAAAKAPNSVSCGHKISRPPRKLERKVVGYVYQS